MYEDLENINADRVNMVVFKLHQIKRRAFFLGHPVDPDKFSPNRTGLF